MSNILAIIFLGIGVGCVFGVSIIIKIIGWKLLTNPQKGFLSKMGAGGILFFFIAYLFFVTKAPPSINYKFWGMIFIVLGILGFFLGRYEFFLYSERGFERFESFAKKIQYAISSFLIVGGSIILIFTFF
jgi:hypothetical protein